MSFMNSFNPVEMCLLVDVLNTINLVLPGFRDNWFAQNQSYSFSFHCLLSRIIFPCCCLTYKVKYHPQKRVYCLQRLCKYYSHTVDTVADPKLTLGAHHIQCSMFLISISTYCFLFDR